MLRSDGEPMCPHCALASAADAWRKSRGGAEFVKECRPRLPQDQAHFTDRQMLRAGLVRGLAVVYAELVEESLDQAEALYLAKTFSGALDQIRCERDQPKGETA